MATGRERWDVVCRVVDNFGDVGIAWRLARQLAVDDARAVRLVVDGLDALAQIAPTVDPSAAYQRVASVDIVPWSAIDKPDPTIADVVVELLGCGLPDRYLDAMARRAIVWIDFDHLSAEAWVDDFHGLPSPHPTRALTKHFYYPGFGARTGGLLVETDFAARQASFTAMETDGFLATLGIRTEPGALRVSLFAYPEAPVASWLTALADDATRRWHLIVMGSTFTSVVDRWFGGAGRVGTRGALTVTMLPFVDQDDYDRLLGACDVNVVRGEDSFVRAQLAGKPFVWHIYRQPDAVHLAKLAAFEDLHEAPMPSVVGAAQRAFWQAWNDPTRKIEGAVEAWRDALPVLCEAAAAWRARILADTPLVARLTAFVRARQASP